MVALYHTARSHQCRCSQDNKRGESQELGFGASWLISAEVEFVHRESIQYYTRFIPFHVDGLGGFGLRLPMSQPHPLKVLTTFGVTAAVSGTRIKMNDL